MDLGGVIRDVEAVWDRSCATRDKLRRHYSALLFLNRRTMVSSVPRDLSGGDMSLRTHTQYLMRDARDRGQS